MGEGIAVFRRNSPCLVNQYWGRAVGTPVDALCPPTSRGVAPSWCCSVPRALFGPLGRAEPIGVGLVPRSVMAWGSAESLASRLMFLGARLGCPHPFVPGMERTGLGLVVAAGGK